MIGHAAMLQALPVLAQGEAAQKCQRSKHVGTVDSFPLANVR